MAKRVSLKGRGADIFFGDYPAVESDKALAEGESGTDTPTPASPDAPIPEVSSVNQASEQESKKARKQESKKTSGPVVSNSSQLPAGPLAADILNSIWQHVSEQATITNAFRYTSQELGALTDVLYEITKRHGVKLSKQDIARLGLNAVISDYRSRGDASLLGELVIRRKRQREDG